MRPRPEVQIGWGWGAAAVVVVLIAVLALVPDPFFRQRVVTTTFDDVEALSPGAPVYFRGAAAGAIRSVRLVPEARTFAVRLGVRRDWKPSACTHARIVESNPLTTPRVELVALESPAATCQAARATAGCAVIPPANKEAAALPGCKRAPDLFETAALAVAQAADVAKVANTMALQIAAMMPKGGKGGPAVDVNKLAADATETLASINAMTGRLNASLTPGRGDIALTLANVRQASGAAAQVDIASVNASIRQVETLMAANQARINTLLEQSAAISAETRGLLENVSASMSTTTANLQRTSDSLEALTERLSDDPTFAIRGQKFADPPPPGGAR